MPPDQPSVGVHAAKSAGRLMMADNDLTPADAAVLRYLKQRVDNLQDERWRRDALPSIENELQVAMRDLREFTSAMRQQGHNI